MLQHRGRAGTETCRPARASRVVSSTSRCDSSVYTADSTAAKLSRRAMAGKLISKWPWAPAGPLLCEKTGALSILDRADGSGQGSETWQATWILQSRESFVFLF